MLKPNLNYETPKPVKIFMGTGGGGGSGGSSSGCSSNSKGQCSSGYNAYNPCSSLSTTNGCARGKGTDGSRKDGEKR